MIKNVGFNTCHIKLTGLHHELIEDRYELIKNEYNLDCAYLDINGIILVVYVILLDHHLVRQRSIKLILMII